MIAWIINLNKIEMLENSIFLKKSNFPKTQINIQMCDQQYKMSN